ncbi:hypothetical protein [Acinetobacter vivianii]|uniref:hypothetical protein n=1 Tax=Acinetobacter vivianii TaxID=1776742 RepID=UPI004042A557
MGEWSEYFEDFPEENPSNYDDNGRYKLDPSFKDHYETIALIDKHAPKAEKLQRAKNSKSK